MIINTCLLSLLHIIPIFTPMEIKKHIPNLITSGNLVCGSFAIMLTLNGQLITACWFILLAALLDFFDGFAARMLNVASPIGKQLDSLADMVTFGLAPAAIAYQLIDLGMRLNNWEISLFFGFNLIALVALVIVVFSAMRLAEFNVSTEQSDSFIGMPTPANAMFWISIPFIANILAPSEGNDFSDWIISSNELLAHLTNPILLIVLSIGLSLLMVAPLPLFALKFKNFTWQDNKVRFVFLGLSLLAIIGAFVIGFWAVAIPVVLLLYVALSAVSKKETN